MSDTKDTRPFASTADIEVTTPSVSEIVGGVYAYTAEGDPNLGAIVGGESVIAIDGRATPTAMGPWLRELREITELPVRYLVLTHYHAVRVLGASALDPGEVVSSAETLHLIRERGRHDWESEFRRMPRLAEDPDSVPGLTVPSVTFSGRISLHLGDREVQVLSLGRGHTAGDAVVWLPEDRVLFAGDLVEAGAACYMGDAYIEEWRTETLDAVAALNARAVVPGRGAVVVGEAAVEAAIATTREFLDTTIESVAAARAGGADLKGMFEAAHAAMAPRFGDWPIFEHCLPFNVSRARDELDGLEPQVWTADRDRAVWDALHG